MPKLFRERQSHRQVCIFRKRQHLKSNPMEKELRPGEPNETKTTHGQTFSAFFTVSGETRQLERGLVRGLKEECYAAPRTFADMLTSWHVKVDT